MAYGDITKKVIDLLAQLGPMTAKEVAAEMGMPVPNISMVLSRCAKRLKRNRNSEWNKRIYIHSWVTERIILSGGRVRTVPRMVFAAGDRKNAIKPKPKDVATRCREWRDKNKGQTNSVFNIGKRDTSGLFHG